MKNWWIILIITISLLVGSVGVGIFIQQNPLIHSFDSFGYELIASGPHLRWLDVLIRPFDRNFLPWGSQPSFYYPMILGALIYLLIRKPKLFPWALGCFIFGTLYVGLVTAVDWHFVFRARPFDSLPNNLDEASKSMWRSWSSFPSGHVRETTLYAAIIENFIPKLKIPLILFCIFIGFSRIYVGAHFPTDVLAGAVIGFLCAKVTLLVLQEVQKWIPKERLELE